MSPRMFTPAKDLDAVLPENFSVKIYKSKWKHLFHIVGSKIQVETFLATNEVYGLGRRLFALCPGCWWVHSLVQQGEDTRCFAGSRRSEMSVSSAECTYTGRKGGVRDFCLVPSLESISF